MKKLLLLLGVLALGLCFAVPAYAQIPNAGFENWVTVGSYMNPTGWSTTNVPGTAISVTRVTTPHGGSYAVRGEVSAYFGVPWPVLLMTTPGFAWTQRSAALTGYYQFSAASGSTDSLYVSVLLYKANTGYAAGGAVLGNSSAYRQFSLPIYYATSANPDSAIIMIVIVGPGDESAAAHIGSYFLVDDLAFSGVASAVEKEGSSLPNAFALQQNYPNPFNPSTRIDFSVAQPGLVTLKVYNVLGSEVATLVNEPKAAGRYSVNWNAAGLSSGVYLYRMAVTSEQGTLFNDVKRLVLLK